MQISSSGSTEYKSIMMHHISKVDDESVCGNREVWLEIYVGEDETLEKMRSLLAVRRSPRFNEV